MAIIRKKAEYFWHQEPGEGRQCETCKADIYGTSYIPVMQVGEAVELIFKDIDLRLCKGCYSALPDDKK